MPKSARFRGENRTCATGTASGHMVVNGLQRAALSQAVEILHCQRKIRGVGRKGFHAKPQRREEGQSSKKCVFLRRQEPRLDPCLGSHQSSTLMGALRRGTMRHGDQASFELRGSSGEVAARRGGRAARPQRHPACRSSKRQPSVDQHAAQRAAGPDGRNGDPVRESVRA